MLAAPFDDSRMKGGAIEDIDKILLHGDSFFSVHSTEVMLTLACWSGRKAGKVRSKHAFLRCHMQLKYSLPVRGIYFDSCVSLCPLR